MATKLHRFRGRFFKLCLFVVIFLVIIVIFSNNMSSTMMQMYYERKILSYGIDHLYKKADETRKDGLDPKEVEKLPEILRNFLKIQNYAPIQPVVFPIQSFASSSFPKPYLGNVSSVYPPGFDYSPIKICRNQGKNLRLLIIVTTAPDHFQFRNSIRKTWGNFGKYDRIDLAFIVGSSSVEINGKVDAENEHYDDIIRAKFTESYFNLTLKTTSLLEWANTYCRKVKFVAKVDDDSFLNMPNLVKFIESHQNDTRSVYGRVGINWEPCRIVGGKYCLSWDEYQERFLPPFATGPAYMLTGDSIEPLYLAALDTKFVKLEDVMITGIVGNRIGLNKVHVKEFKNDEISNPCEAKNLISFHMIQSDRQLEYWNSINDKNKCP